MKSQILCTFFVSLLLLASGHLFAQEWQGLILKQYDQFNPQPTSAAIFNKTQNKRTYSDEHGAFRVKASVGDSITIDNHVQYHQEIPDFRFTIGFGSDYKIKDTTFIWKGQDTIFLPVILPELVEDGHRIRLLTDKQQILKSKYFNPGNRFDPYQLIQGKIPGVVVTRPGGDPNYAYQVQIRGLHSAIYNRFAYFPTATGYNEQFNLTQPLVVVDGLPGLALNSVDPQDIASIEVIRDVASLAEYGMRGANGVIVIQTKRGKTRSRGLEYSTYFAMDRASNPDLGISAATYRNLIGSNGKYQGVNQDLGATTDWYKSITRTGFSQAHNLALSGSSLSSAYRLAVNLRQVNGIAKKSDFDQVNALFNFQQDIAKGKGGLSGIFSISRRNTSEVSPDIFRNAALMNPTAPIRSDTGYYAPRLFGLYNPVALQEQNTYENAYQTITAGLTGYWKLFKGVVAKVQTGYQHNQDGYGWALAEKVPGGYSSNAAWEERRLRHWYLNGQLEGNWYWKKNTLQTKLGYVLQRWDGKGVDRQGLSFEYLKPSYRPLINYAGNEPGWLVDEKTYRESDEMPAIFGQAQYTFNGKWFVQGNLRREGFTRLGESNKWALYPAVTLGGTLIQFKNPIDHLGIRLGYGITGNIPPKSHATHQLILPNGSTVFVDGQFKPGIYYPYIPNPNLQSEIRKEINLALDFTLFGERLQGQVQFYRSRSSNLLWQYPTSNGDGFSEQKFENAMALRNQGVEIQLNINAIQTRNLHWQSNLNFAHNRTILDASFPKSSPESISNQLTVGSPGSPGYCCLNLELLQDQKPIGQFYTTQTEGIGQDGQWKFKDVNGDGIYNEPTDKTVTGNAQPTLTLGWDNTIAWNRFSFNVFWRGAFGHDLLNVFNLFYANPQALKNNLGYSIPQVALSGDFSRLTVPFNPVSDYFVQNASFLRLENLSLAYDVPFAKPGSRKSLNLYFSVQNLLTFTSFTGNDPEIRLSNLGAGLVPGLVNPNYFGIQRSLKDVDRGRYPLTRTLTIGAKLKL